MRRSKLSCVIPILTAAVLVTSCGDDGGTPTEPPNATQLARQSFIGSDQCGYCHTDLFNEFMKSGHPYKLNKVENGQPPVYPFSEVPTPPDGISWSEVTYVIGGFGWKARFLGTDGFIITEGGQNQYNLETGQWVDYHKDQQKPYDCGACHTTGYSPEGHQDSLPGIIGTWAFPGIQCEECHGPGKLHSENPQTVRMTIDTRAEACGRCHNRGGMNAQIPASNGFIRHHEQFNELQATGMRELECVTCHDPHTGVRYNDQEGAQAIKVECEDCHSDARTAMLSAPLAAAMGNLECITCHMPEMSKSAVADGPYSGDIKTHIFKINIDSLAEPFTPDGKFANGYLTLEYACLGCHGDETRGWASRNAPNVHGPGFKALPATKFPH